MKTVNLTPLQKRENEKKVAVEELEGEIFY